jgi:hypothetical protein
MHDHPGYSTGLAMELHHGDQVGAVIGRDIGGGDGGIHFGQSVKGGLLSGGL